MNRQDFIIGTLKPYFVDPTTVAVGLLGCVYRTKDGKTCAFGQHILPEKYDKQMEDMSASDVLCDFGDVVLTIEARSQELSWVQWNTIQRVHDRLAGYWLAQTLEETLSTCETTCGVDLSELRSFDSYKS